jgi:hypothetical protein
MQQCSTSTLVSCFASCHSAQPARGGGRMMGGDDDAGESAVSEKHTASIEDVFQTLAPARV